MRKRKSDWPIKTFLGILIAKLVAGFLFASHYMTDWFIPFVNYYVTSGIQNPWDFFLEKGLIKAFPYSSIMLWVFAIPRTLFAPLLSSDWSAVTYLNLVVMRLPILLADLSIFYVLCQWFKSNIRRVVIIYWCSPIVFYINYYHGQLDAIPTAFLMLSLFFLFRHRYIEAVLLLALGIAAKSHLIVAVPFLFMFLRKQNLSMKRLAGLGVLLSTVTVLLLVPYAFTDGYRTLVLEAEEQARVFSVAFPFAQEGYVFYFCPAAIFVVFLKFVNYRKTNQDITILYLGIVYSILVVFVPPMPGWFYWALPFVSYFYVKQETFSLSSWLGLNVFYLFFFLLRPGSDVFEAWGLVSQTVASVPEPAVLLANAGVNSTVFSNLSFTLLIATQIIVVFWIYLVGVRSNEIYRPKESPLTIGIGGDSGAGKDTLMKTLASLFDSEDVVCVQGDDDHKWPRGHNQWQMFTHLNPKANNLHAQMEQAVALTKGETVYRVQYDHKTGSFTEPVEMEPRKCVFFVGLHPFYLERMRRLIQIKIFVNPDENLRIYWKMKRDVDARGYKPEEVLQQVSKRKTDSDRFIHPQEKFADMVINYKTATPLNVKKIDLNVSPEIKLQIRLNNSLFIDPLLERINASGTMRASLVPQDDLHVQRIEFEGELSPDEAGAIADAVIPNRAELMSPGAQWQEGLGGVIQLLFLTYLSELSKMKKIDATPRPY